MSEKLTLDQQIRVLRKALDMYEATDSICSGGDVIPKVRVLVSAAHNVLEMLPHGPDRYALTVALDPFLGEAK